VLQGKLGRESGLQFTCKRGAEDKLGKRAPGIGLPRSDNDVPIQCPYPALMPLPAKTKTPVHNKPSYVYPSPTRRSTVPGRAYDRRHSPTTAAAMGSGPNAWQVGAVPNPLVSNLCMVSWESTFALSRLPPQIPATPAAHTHGTSPRTVPTESSQAQLSWQARRAALEVRPQRL
jgi:hypothetical protein